MASPQPNRNFAIISNEILEAKAAHKVTEAEARVIDVVLRETWGRPGAPKMAPLSNADVGRLASGVSGDFASRVINRLVKRCVLKREDRDGVRFIGIQKDYDCWLQATPKQLTLDLGEKSVDKSRDRPTPPPTSRPGGGRTSSPTPPPTSRPTYKVRKAEPSSTCGSPKTTEKTEKTKKTETDDHLAPVAAVFSRLLPAEKASDFARRYRAKTGSVPRALEVARHVAREAARSKVADVEGLIGFALSLADPVTVHGKGAYPEETLLEERTRAAKGRAPPDEELAAQAKARDGARAARAALDRPTKPSPLGDLLATAMPAEPARSGT